MYDKFYLVTDQPTLSRGTGPAARMPMFPSQIALFAPSAEAAINKVMKYHTKIWVDNHNWCLRNSDDALCSGYEPQPQFSDYDVKEEEYSEEAWPRREDEGVLGYVPKHKWWEYA